MTWLGFLQLIGCIAAFTFLFRCAYLGGRKEGMIDLSAHLMAHGHITPGAAICATRFIDGKPLRPEESELLRVLALNNEEVSP